jgi:hypothetical protein
LAKSEGWDTQDLLDVHFESQEAYLIGYSDSLKRVRLNDEHLSKGIGNKLFLIGDQKISSN